MCLHWTALYHFLSDLLCKTTNYSILDFSGPETSQVASSQQYLPGASAANNLQGSSGPGSSNSSIARSVSFMSKRQENRVNAYDNYAPIGWRTGRNSVEGTPTSSRKGLVQSKTSSMNGSTSNKQSPPGNEYGILMY